MIKVRLYRMLTILKQWFDPRLQRTQAELHRFIARIYLCGGLGYALLYLWFGLNQWNMPWRVPALGNLVGGVINAVLISALFRFNPTRLRQHIERWRVVASANLLLWLFNFAWLASLNTGWSFDALPIIYFHTVNVAVTLAVLYWLRRFTRLLPETSKD